MRESTAKVLRVATIVVFGAVVAAVGVVAWRTFNPGPSIREAEPGADEVSVARSIDVSGYGTLTVRGFVFKGPGGLGLRLCDGMRNGEPPLCRGPFLDLDGVNEGSFVLEEAATDDGPVLWNDESVALRGAVAGTRMSVQQVLR